jgi:hypothetical protein
MSSRKHGTAKEHHWRVKELAAEWHMSKQSIIALFRDEPGVPRTGTGKRTTLYIPDSVADRVYARISKVPTPAPTDPASEGTIIGVHHVFKL